VIIVFESELKYENPETDQMQDERSSGEGQSPRVEKDEGQETEILSI